MKRTEVYKQTLDILTKQENEPVEMMWLAQQYALHPQEFDYLIKMRIDAGANWFDMAVAQEFSPHVIALFDSFVNSDEQGV